MDSSDDSIILSSIVGKKKRLVISLEQKFDVIARHERGHSNYKIGRDLGMPESTVRNIIKHSEEIKEKGRVALALGDWQVSTTNRSLTMMEMERLLAAWIEECNRKHIPLSRAVIQKKALSLFNKVKSKHNQLDKRFTASIGWFDRFKTRVQLHNFKPTGATPAFGGDSKAKAEATGYFVDRLESASTSHEALPSSSFSLPSGESSLASKAGIKSEISDTPYEGKGKGKAKASLPLHISRKLVDGNKAVTIEYNSEEDEEYIAVNAGEGAPWKLEYNNETDSEDLEMTGRLEDQEAMLTGQKESDYLQDRITDVQVKDEPEDTGYENRLNAPTGHDSNANSRNSSPLPPIHFENTLPVPTGVPPSITAHPVQIPLNDLFAGSTIRSQLQGAIAGKKMDTVQNIVEGLLKKNETLLAMSDAGGFKPNARRARAAHDGFIKRSEPAFPAAGKPTVFPISSTLQARVDVSNRKNVENVLKPRMARPKSPTLRHTSILKDKTHFTYALMESNAADNEIEKIFNVQNHELVCGISSKSFVTDKSDKVVASLDFGYFWCNFCPFTTNNKPLLIQHALEHRFSCKFCVYESFCRSDVVRHMHKVHSENFTETASRLSYCTLLSDYLRVKARAEGKENKDPDEDIDDIDPQEMQKALEELEHRKRKTDSTFNEAVPSPAKSAKVDSEDGESLDGVHKDRLGKSRKSQHPKRHAPLKDSDYDIFEMEVEEISEAPEPPDDSESDRVLYSSNHNSPNPYLHGHDNQPHPTGMMQAASHSQNSPMQNYPSSSSSSKPQRGSSGNKVRGPYVRNNRSSSTSSLYWSCGYCSFQSNSQAEIKEHSNREHPGKPHRYVALIKNMTPDSIINKNPRTVNRNSNVKHSVPAISPDSRHRSQSPQVHHSPASSVLSQASNDSFPTNGEEEAEDIVSLRDSPSSLKVKLAPARGAKKESTVYRCYHCTYTAKRHSSMKSHIYYKHRGKGLVAVDEESSTGQQVFFCARDDCTFKSESPRMFLNHVDQCTPWNKPELADVEVEPHIRECLDQTVSFAEMAKEKVVEKGRGVSVDETECSDSNFSVFDEKDTDGSIPLDVSSDSDSSSKSERMNVQEIGDSDSESDLNIDPEPSLNKITSGSTYSYNVHRNVNNSYLAVDEKDVCESPQGIKSCMASYVDLEEDLALESDDSFSSSDNDMIDISRKHSPSAKCEKSGLTIEKRSHSPVSVNSFSNSPVSVNSLAALESTELQKDNLVSQSALSPVLANVSSNVSNSPEQSGKIDQLATVEGSGIQTNSPLYKNDESDDLKTQDKFEAATKPNGGGNFSVHTSPAEDHLGVDQLNTVEKSGLQGRLLQHQQQVLDVFEESSSGLLHNTQDHSLREDLELENTALQSNDNEHQKPADEFETDNSLLRSNSSPNQQMMTDEFEIDNTLLQSNSSPNQQMITNELEKDELENKLPHHSPLHKKLTDEFEIDNPAYQDNSCQQNVQAGRFENDNSALQSRSHYHQNLTNELVVESTVLESKSTQPDTLTQEFEMENSASHNITQHSGQAVCQLEHENLAFQGNSQYTEQNGTLSRSENSTQHCTRSTSDELEMEESTPVDLSTTQSNFYKPSQSANEEMEIGPAVKSWVKSVQPRNDKLLQRFFGTEEIHPVQSESVDNFSFPSQCNNLHNVEPAKDTPIDTVFSDTKGSLNSCSGLTGDEELTPAENSSYYVSSAHTSQFTSADDANYCGMRQISHLTHPEELRSAAPFDNSSTPLHSTHCTSAYEANFSGVNQVSPSVPVHRLTQADEFMPAAPLDVGSTDVSQYTHVYDSNLSKVSHPVPSRRLTQSEESIPAPDVSQYTHVNDSNLSKVSHSVPSRRLTGAEESMPAAPVDVGSTDVSQYTHVNDSNLSKVSHPVPVRRLTRAEESIPAAPVDVGSTDVSQYTHVYDSNLSKVSHPVPTCHLTKAEESIPAPDVSQYTHVYDTTLTEVSPKCRPLPISPLTPAALLDVSSIVSPSHTSQHTPAEDSTFRDVSHIDHPTLISDETPDEEFLQPEASSDDVSPSSSSLYTSVYDANFCEVSHVSHPAPIEEYFTSDNCQSLDYCTIDNVEVANEVDYLENNSLHDTGSQFEPAVMDTGQPCPEDERSEEHIVRPELDYVEEEITLSETGAQEVCDEILDDLCEEEIQTQLQNLAETQAQSQNLAERQTQLQNLAERQTQLQNLAETQTQLQNLAETQTQLQNLAEVDVVVPPVAVVAPPEAVVPPVTDVTPPEADVVAPPVPVVTPHVTEAALPVGGRSALPIVESHQSSPTFKQKPNTKALLPGSTKAVIEKKDQIMSPPLKLRFKLLGNMTVCSISDDTNAAKVDEPNDNKAESMDASDESDSSSGSSSDSSSSSGSSSCSSCSSDSDSEEPLVADAEEPLVADVEEPLVADVEKPLVADAVEPLVAEERLVAEQCSDDTCKPVHKQVPEWLNELIDSTGDSDSDMASNPRSVPLSVSSVSETYESSYEDPVIRSPKPEVRSFEARPEPEAKKAKLSRGHKAKSKKKELSHSQLTCIPARSAAVKALSKMKPALEDGDSSESGEKLKRKYCSKSKPIYSQPSTSYHVNTEVTDQLKTPRLSSDSDKGNDSGHEKTAVYMCGYCLDVSEGTLKKIKPHVLNKHSSMPPMVVNCFKQRRHERCRFFICSHPDCYKLSSTEKQFERHTLSHRAPTSHKSTGKKAVGARQSKKSNSGNFPACRVELDMLDLRKLKRSSSMSVRLEEKKYQCLYCTGYFYDSTLSGMKAHYAQEHKGQLMVMRDTEARKSQLPSRIYVCEIPNCECCYINRSDLDHHSKIHKSNLTYIYECACCGWYSSSHLAATQHLRSQHADEKNVSLIHMQVSVDEYGQTSKKVL
ncbi:uncharacterized protein LOC131953856 isoform X2 [Physella acuta]|uniref:uncharacterized protein LOC131953856 isoform X2 n=1 Tax=Physella acuta TaxID=109671 RepID=UPI0027DE2993|nr:uncharacterized protein LOC131953856 isoform X2 [Physella acuta]